MVGRLQIRHRFLRLSSPLPLEHRSKQATMEFLREFVEIEIGVSSRYARHAKSAIQKDVAETYRS